VPGIIFDTNIWIAYEPTNIPKSLVMPAVIMQELVAGASDTEAIKRYEAARKQYEREGKFLAPTGEDWWQAGRILNSLLRGLKSKSGGRTPKLHPDEKQRLIRDVLIARIALRSGALLVTDNLADFKKIKRFCNVRLQSGSQYFKRNPGS
jgi:predicted nucleic acid-binding protein